MRRALLAALGLIALAILVACDGGQEADDYRPGEPFYLEGQARVEDSHPQGPATVTHLRWWWQDARHFRQEFERQDIPASPTVVLRDGGDRVLSYQEGASTYSSQAVPAELGDRVYPLPISAVLGPLAYDTVDEFLEAWLGMPSIEHASRSGTDSVLGREVEVIEYGPTWRSSSSAGGERAGGVGRIYIDAASMMVLRSEADGQGGGQAYRVEVTTLDLAPDFEDGVFDFSPPPGATERDGLSRLCSYSGSSGAGTSQRHAVPSGFLQLAELPEGWVQTEERLAVDPDCPVQEVMVILADVQAPTERWLAFTQYRSLESSVVPDQGDHVDLGGGRTGYASVSDGSERLLWSQDGIVALLVSNVLDRQELLRIAASAEVAP